MITTTEIGDILYRDCKVFNLPLQRRPIKVRKDEKLTRETIVILVKKQSSEKYWKKTFADINFCIPDMREDIENTTRLGELEKLANLHLDNVTSQFKETRYRYGIESVGIEADTALKCHYVNLRILFEVLNTL